MKAPKVSLLSAVTAVPEGYQPPLGVPLIFIVGASMVCQVFTVKLSLLRLLMARSGKTVLARI